MLATDTAIPMLNEMPYACYRYCSTDAKGDTLYVLQILHVPLPKEMSYAYY